MLSQGTTSWCRFFPTDDQPQYSDHDFPLCKSKILPSGYMVLEKPTESHVLQSARRRSRSLTRAPTNAHTRGVSGGRSRSWNERHDHEHPSRHLKEGEVDNLQRFHWPTPHSGRLFTFNRAARFHDATCSQHYSDLCQLIGHHFSEKGVLSLPYNVGLLASSAEFPAFLILPTSSSWLELVCLL